MYELLAWIERTVDKIVGYDGRRYQDSYSVGDAVFILVCGCIIIASFPVIWPWIRLMRWVGEIRFERK